MASTAKKLELEVLLAAGEKALQNYMMVNGRKYPTDEWLTVSEYCKRFHIANTQTVTNWIKRGVISESDVLVIEEYNNIRLVKAISYRD
jgi:hypothetical protein